MSDTIYGFISTNDHRLQCIFNSFCHITDKIIIKKGFRHAAVIHIKINKDKDNVIFECDMIYEGDGKCSQADCLFNRTHTCIKKKCWNKINFKQHFGKIIIPVKHSDNIHDIKNDVELFLIADGQLLHNFGKTHRNLIYLVDKLKVDLGGEEHTSEHELYDSPLDKKIGYAQISTAGKNLQSYLTEKNIELTDTNTLFGAYRLQRSIESIGLIMNQLFENNENNKKIYIFPNIDEPVNIYKDGYCDDNLHNSSRYTKYTFENKSKCFDKFLNKKSENVMCVKIKINNNEIDIIPQQHYYAVSDYVDEPTTPLTNIIYTIEMIKTGKAEKITKPTSEEAVEAAQAAQAAQVAQASEPESAQVDKQTPEVNKNSKQKYLKYKIKYLQLKKKYALYY